MRRSLSLPVVILVALCAGLVASCQGDTSGPDADGMTSASIGLDLSALGGPGFTSSLDEATLSVRDRDGTQPLRKLPIESGASSVVFENIRVRKGDVRFEASIVSSNGRTVFACGPATFDIQREGPVAAPPCDCLDVPVLVVEPAVLTLSGASQGKFVVTNKGCTDLDWWVVDPIPSSISPTATELRLSPDVLGRPEPSALDSLRVAPGESVDLIVEAIKPQASTFDVTFQSDSAGPAKATIILQATGPPVADAGGDLAFNVAPGGTAQAQLNGTGSYDPDGAQITDYAWSYLGGPGAPGAIGMLAEPSVGPLNVGIHAFGLVVTAEGETSAQDTVLVTVATSTCLPPVPIANAGADQGLIDTNGDGVEGTTLDASGSSGCRPLAYNWSYLSGPGSPGPIAAVEMPAVNDLTIGTHAFGLVIVDSAGVASAPDTVTVTVGTCSDALMAKAGPDQRLFDADGNGVEGTTLDGSASTGCSPLSYSWTYVSGPGSPGSIASVAQPTVNNLALGTHTFSLVVTDSAGTASPPDLVDVIVETCPAPIADAGPNQTLTDTDGNGVESTTLDGSASAGCKPLSFSWTHLSGPGSPVSIAPVEKPFVGGLQVGTHTFGLTVTDTRGVSSSQDVVAVTVLPRPGGPIADAGPDQTLVDSDGNGSEDTQLDGTGSTGVAPLTYSWTYESGPGAPGPIAGEPQPVVTGLNLGVHTISLVVTDGNGISSAPDIVVVRVDSNGSTNTKPVADAGENQEIRDPGGDGELVTLDGSGSFDPDPGDTIESYEWSERGSVLVSVSTDTVTVPLSVGHHIITLRVRDDGSPPLWSAPDTVEVLVGHEAAIDVKPSISCNNPNQGMPVTLLSSPGFDPGTINAASVTFGVRGRPLGTGATEIHGGPHQTNANNDGIPDLTFHFRLGDTSLGCSDTTASLYGLNPALSGALFIGVDDVEWVSQVNTTSVVPLRR